MVLQRLAGSRRCSRVVVTLAAATVGCLSLASASWASGPWNLTIPVGFGYYATPIPGPATLSPLDFPTGIAVDGAGGFYIGDTANVVVEHVDSTGILSIFAGNGSSGTPSPGIALDSPLDAPQGLAVNAAGDVYVADGSANVIEKVTPGGVLSVVAGTGTASSPNPGLAIDSNFNDPMAVAVDASGNLYVADAGNNVIEKITPGGMLSVLAGNGTDGPPNPGLAIDSPLDDPTALAIDASGDLYVADGNNDVIEEITPGGILSVVAGNGTNGSPSPGPATDSPLGEPVGVAVDSAGNLFISDNGNNQVEEVTPDGTLSVIAGGMGMTPMPGPALDSPLPDPQQLAVDSLGNVYVVDDGYAAIMELSPPQPNNLTLPQISGSSTAGQTLSASGDTWDVAPVTDTYQWELCDSAGNDCSAISGAESSTYVLSAADVGDTILVAVTATNGGGFTEADSAVTSLVAAAPPTLTIPTPTIPTATPTPIPRTPTSSSPPTTTTTTTPSVPGSQDGVSLVASAANTGVAVSGSGTAQLPLTCPHTASGCDADGLLALALSSASRKALIAKARTPIQDSVLARFSGVKIQTGRSRLVSVKLTPAATRYLQTRGVRRVLVTLTIHNHLSGGPDVSTAQQVWLNIAALGASCPAAAGTLTGSRIAQMRLGLTRSQAHRLGRHRRVAFGFERYCLTGGAIRVRNPGPKLLDSLSQAQRRRDTGRIYLALTGNKHYSAAGVRAGMTLRQARAHLRLGAGVTVGKNTWYLVASKQGAWVLKVQRGTIGEIGITPRSLTRTHRARALLLHNL